MNLFDTFPRRNLPREAEEWGRSVEGKIYELENEAVSGKQSVDGLNRNTAATLQDLAKQLSLLDEQVQRIDSLFNQLPKGSQANVNPTAFAVLGTNWRNIAAVTFPAPASGNFSISANAVGRLQTSSTSTNTEVTYRLMARGSAGPVIQGVAWSPEGEWQNSFSLSWGWNLTVGEGEDVVVSLQARPEGGTTWAAHPATYATLQADADFRVS